MQAATSAVPMEQVEEWVESEDMETASADKDLQAWNNRIKYKQL